MILVIRQEMGENELTIYAHFLGGEHKIIVPRDAIAKRMLFYELNSEADAVDAILREHYYRLAGKQITVPQGSVRKDISVKERGKITGGLDESVKIVGRK